MRQRLDKLEEALARQRRMLDGAVEQRKGKPFDYQRFARCYESALVKIVRPTLDTPRETMRTVIERQMTTYNVYLHQMTPEELEAAIDRVTDRYASLSEEEWRVMGAWWESQLKVPSDDS